jgi:hypothetical protein
MGTRCLTVFKNDKDKEICVMYRQFDGYPNGHGVELANFLSGGKLCNGITGKEDKCFNGMEDLVAQVISHFKNEPGGFYIHPAGTRDIWEEYIYTVTGELGKEPKIECHTASGELIAKGSATVMIKKMSKK